MSVVRASSQLLLLAAALLVAGCAAATQNAYIAPTYDTIVSSTEERTGEPPVHSMYVENRSTVPVVVFSVSLSACQNVRDPCTPHPINQRVAPGQKQLVLRVTPWSAERAFSYRFAFSWRADSSDARAMSALAGAGDASAQQRLADRQRGDSVRRAAAAAGYNELSRDDFKALGARVAALRAVGDSLVLSPGQKAGVDDIRIVLLDSAGRVLGSTHWVRWRVPSTEAIQFVPPGRLVAREPGRMELTFALPEEAEQLIGHAVAELRVPVVVAVTAEPGAPVFQGLAVDADSRTPLGCAAVALEDADENVVVRGRTDRTGLFTLAAPRPGSYRLRVDTRGWAPVYGPLEAAASGEMKQQQLLVRFTEQLLRPRELMDRERFQHAAPVSVSMMTYGMAPGGAARKGTITAVPVVAGVTLGGSESAPVLGIMGAAPTGRAWLQFVVDDAGKVDTASIQLPAELDPSAAASVKAVLPRVRFAPARAAGTPVCELQRMEVSFTRR